MNVGVSSGPTDVRHRAPPPVCKSAREGETVEGSRTMRNRPFLLEQFEVKTCE